MTGFKILAVLGAIAAGLLLHHNLAIPHYFKSNESHAVAQSITDQDEALNATGTIQ